MTPLMKPRLDTDSDVCSDIFVSSIAGSPRRVVNRPEREGFGQATIIPYGLFVQSIFLDGGRCRRCLRLSPGCQVAIRCPAVRDQVAIRWAAGCDVIPA